MVGHIRSINTREAYSDLLQLFSNYFGAIEAQVDPLIGPAVLADYTQRRKTKSLENDIIALGGTANRNIQAEDVPEITNILQAFGALYVMEGSTLGGPHIVRMIQKKLDTAVLKGFSFFQSYGDDMMLMWEKFKQVLDLQAKNEAEQQVILDAANETFLKFKLWINKQSTLKEDVCS